MKGGNLNGSSCNRTFWNRSTCRRRSRSSGICPLWSYRLALRFHNELPGVVVPEPIQEGLRDAGSAAAEYGMALARELMVEAREKAQGAYLVAPFRKPLGILELLAS